MRLKNIALAVALGALIVSGPAAGQDMPTEAEMMAAWEEAMAVGPEHMALTARAGTWSSTTSYPAEPGSEEMITEQGTVERTATLEGRVLEERIQGTMMGQPYSGIGRTGYDNVTDRYWTTWNDTMSTGLMVMYGSYDDATSTYTFEGSSADPLLGEVPMRVEQVIEGPDRETMRLFMEFPEQGMIQVMEIAYERLPE